MNRIAVFVIATVFATSAQGQPKTIKLPELLSVLNERSDDIQIVNFWATWCAPCVKELPLFEQYYLSKPDNVSLVLVSMDLDLDPNPEKVYKFVERKKLKSPVVLLDEPDPNTWINRVHEGWSGALPATFIINRRTGKRKFVEKELHEGELQKLIEEVK